MLNLSVALRKAAALSLTYGSCLLLGCRPVTQFPCLRGKYLGDYCEGSVVQLAPTAPLGKTWTNAARQSFSNCVLANIDSVALKGSTPPRAFNAARDSTFYFQYREGKYPQKLYILCQSLPGITITTTAPTGCPAP